MSQGLTPSQTIGPFYFGTIIKAYHPTWRRRA